MALCSAEQKTLAALLALVLVTTARAIDFNCSQAGEGALRLVAGRSHLDGLVEVCGRDGLWGVVCEDPWGDAEAAVACRQLGFSATGAVGQEYQSPGRFDNENENSVQIRLRGGRCNGSEERLTDCGEFSTTSCFSSKASASCQPLFPGQLPPMCEAGLFQCNNSNCVYDAEEDFQVAHVCDLRDDCLDCSDECHCSGAVFSSSTDFCRNNPTTLCECTDEEFQCDNGYCAPLDVLCDDRNNCGDLSDERVPECLAIAAVRREEVDKAAETALRTTLLSVLIPLAVVTLLCVLVVVSCMLLPVCPLREAYSGKSAVSPNNTATGHDHDDGGSTADSEDHSTPLASALP